MESSQEFVDVTAKEYSSDLNNLKKEINSGLPLGVEVLEIRTLSAGEADLARTLQGFSYELYLPADTTSERLTAMADNIQKFLAAASFNINRLTKGKTISKNIRPFVEKLVIQPMEKKIKLTVQHFQQGSARPTDIIVNILDYNDEESKQVRVVKTKTLLQSL